MRITMPWMKNDIDKLRLLPSGMKDRGEYLLRNPRKGKKTLCKTPAGHKVTGNCFGATIFLEGNGMLERCHDVAGRIFSNGGDFWVYNKDVNTPGYVDVYVMQEVLEEFYDKVETPAPGDLLVMEEMGYRDGWWLGHTCVWTGIENYVLEQFGNGKKFGIRKVPKRGMLPGCFFVKRND